MTQQFKANNNLYRFLPIISFALVLILWSLVSFNNPNLIPSLLDIWNRFTLLLVEPLSGATLTGHIWASLLRVLIAFVLVIFIGIALGVLFGWYFTFNSLVYPVFEILRFIPPIAWIPLVILWLGIGEAPKIAIVFIGSITPVVMNTYAGIKNIDKLIIDAGRVLGADRRQLLFEVAIPASIPQIIAGIKTALSGGWMCVVAAEMIVARQGVGFLIVRGQESGDTALIIVCMITIGVVNSLLSLLLNKIEKVSTPWRI